MILCPQQFFIIHFRIPSVMNEQNIFPFGLPWIRVYTCDKSDGINHECFPLTYTLWFEILKIWLIFILDKVYTFCLEF